MIITLIRRALAAKKQNDTPTPTVCSHRDDPSIEPCMSCKAEKRAATKYRWKLVLGLILPFALQAFDSTMYANPSPFVYFSCVYLTNNYRLV